MRLSTNAVFIWILSHFVFMEPLWKQTRVFFKRNKKKRGKFLKRCCYYSVKQENEQASSFRFSVFVKERVVLVKTATLPNLKGMLKKKVFFPGVNENLQKKKESNWCKRRKEWTHQKNLPIAQEPCWLFCSKQIVLLRENKKRQDKVYSFCLFH